jgi:hypothetical protein
MHQYIAEMRPNAEMRRRDTAPEPARLVMFSLVTSTLFVIEVCGIKNTRTEPD